MAHPLSPMALLTEIDMLPLTATDAVVLFGVITRCGCSRRDVATAVVLIDPAESGSSSDPLFSFLNRPESMMRGDLKRGLTKFTAKRACVVPCAHPFGAFQDS